MKRGELWWASLKTPIGSGPGYRRPVLVVQANPFNESKIATVIVAVLTSNVRLASAPGNVRLPPRASGLPKPSVVNVSQLITIDKTLLLDRIRVLPPGVLEEVNAGLRQVLALR